VLFIIPDGYRGPVDITEHKGGNEVPFEDGRYVYRVPTNGVLKVTVAEGFRRWHQSSAIYESGGAIPMRQTSDPESAPNSVAFYNLWFTQSKYSFFVGTRSQMLNLITHPPAENEAVEFWRSLTNSSPGRDDRTGAR
jgi:hypothetical protein